MKANITILAVVLLFGACTSDDEGGQKGLVPITLTTTTLVNTSLATRTTSTDLQSSQFASGQTFYVYFHNSGTTSIDHATYTADGSGGTTTTTTPYFTLSGASTDVWAYYPSSVTEATTSFVVEADQNTDASYRASDLMFASTTISKVFPTSTGALTFAHKMAKIRVNVTVNAGVSVSSVKLKNIKRQVPFTASTGAIGTAVVSGSTDVTMFTSAGETSNFSCVALVPPQSAAANATLITVTTANHTLVYELPSAVTFASGYQYVYNVSVFDTQLIVTTNITAWDTTPTAQSGQGTLNRPRLPIEYVAPYNMQTATTMATDNLKSHSMYFCWNESTATNGGVGTVSWTSAKANIQAMIKGTAVPGYHLPSKAEWCSVVAPNIAGSDDTSMGGSTGQRITYKRGSSSNLSETVAWGVTNSNGTYTYDVNQVFYNDYNCPNDAAHTYIGYGLRFKELNGGNYVNGQYTCAYRYEYKSADVSVGGGASLTIQVKYVGANADITISTISNESWWNLPDFSVVFPACGYSPYPNGSDQNAGWGPANSPETGFYRSATVKDASYVFYMNFHNVSVSSNNSGLPGHGFSVRLFKDAN